MLEDYKARKAAGYFDPFQPLSTRQLLRQMLLRLDNPCMGQLRVAGYSCPPAITGLVDAQQLEEEQTRQLDLLAAAAAEAGEAADGGGDGGLPGGHGVR